MPAYFPEGSQGTNAYRYDAEQPKDMRYPSTSSRPYTANTIVKPGHSRSASAASQGYTNSRSGSRSHSRSGSAGLNYTTASPTRSHSSSANHSRTGSRSGRSHTPSNGSRLDLTVNTELHALSSDRPPPQTPQRQLNLTNGHQHPMNPLRMSPFSPPAAPRLPRLPENMAVVGSLESSRRNSRQERPMRTPLFHKPLPITPLPGHQNAPQYLTTSKDQAILPMMLSPGLVPEPLTLGAKSPSQSSLNERPLQWA